MVTKQRLGNDIYRRGMNVYRVIFTVLLISVLCRAYNLDISDDGWRLWPDTSAAWENDEIFLPEDVDLATMPVNIPTGGWDVLNQQQGISITLPSTVEEYYWGKFGFRNYHNAYYFENEDDQVKNGNYPGVSWWWKEIDIPQEALSKILTLHVRAARLRAEVYLNRQLVGYNIIPETSFSCDISKVVKPGKNLLAIRITNPGGRLDWVDTKLMRWGDKEFHAGHGFGGLDRGLVISVHDPVYIKDFYALNSPDVHTLNTVTVIRNESDSDQKGTVILELTDAVNNDRVCARQKKTFSLSAGKLVKIDGKITHKKAQLWNIDNPKLYRLKVIVKCKKSNYVDEQEKNVGFRWFMADGVGENAVLRLNGKRIRLTSAISWGFWGQNGMFPTPEMAKKEVMAAKAFGMNCLHFHRHLGKAEVLDSQDKIGLLRYMEPGGGQTALGKKYTMYAPSPKTEIDISGKAGAPKSFAEKFMEEKILRMIRDHRSHPSLIIYSVQNEIAPDLRNPRIFNLIRKMHAEDPSRIISLKSGIPPENQVWMQPYDTTIYYDRGDAYSGWWDQHTVGGPGVWQDNMYKNPEKFTHRSTNEREIVVWGEMLGAAVSDDHVRMIKEIESGAGVSYDLADHKEILQAYDNFLDKWKFRKAFPSTEKLFLDIGNKCYDFWGRVIETARLAESNDLFVISGWESTAIENHSGLVDNLRGFKGDPELLRKRLEPVHPVIKARSLVVAVGQRDTLDLFLLNEQGRLATGELNLSVREPDGNSINLGSFQIPEWKKDKFVYPVAEKFVTPILKKEGRYRFTLESAGSEKISSKEEVLVLNPVNTNCKDIKIGVLENGSVLLEQLNEFPHVIAEPYKNKGEYDVIVATDHLLYGWRSIVDSTTEIAGTEDDRLFQTESWGYWKNLEYVFTGLPGKKAKVTLRFAEITLNGPKNRVFDVAINGTKVLDDFDVFVAAGGKNIAVDREFDVDIKDGAVKITIPEIKINYGKFNAIKVEAGDSTIAINCGGALYRDKDGLLWQEYSAEVKLTDKVLTRVENGTPLLLLPQGSEAIDAFARKISDRGAFVYKGHVGNVRASWMGSWLFVKDSPVFKGLPVNCALKSYYQISVSGSDGLLIEGNKIVVFAGYGRDHDRNVGAACFFCPLGRGKVLFFCLPGLVRSDNKAGGIQPVVLKRLLSNSLDYLTSE